MASRTRASDSRAAYSALPSCLHRCLASSTASFRVCTFSKSCGLKPWPIARWPSSTTMPLRRSRTERTKDETCPSAPSSRLRRTNEAQRFGRRCAFMMAAIPCCDSSAILSAQSPTSYSHRPHSDGLHSGIGASESKKLFHFQFVSHVSAYQPPLNKARLNADRQFFFPSPHVQVCSRHAGLHVLQPVSVRRRDLLADAHQLGSR